MNNNVTFVLKTTGRVVYPLTWLSRSEPCPWRESTHMRVLIPLSEMEKRNSKKKVHTQIVRRSSLREVRMATPKLFRVTPELARS